MDNQGTTERYKIWPQLYATLSTSIAMFSGGCVLGWMSPAMSSLLQPESGAALDYNEVSWIASAVHIGGIAGPLFTLLLVDNIGRKKTLLVASLLHASGWSLVIISPTFTPLMIARCLMGAGNGVIISAGPMYIAEISENKRRGALQTVSVSGVSFGILYASIIGPKTTLLGLNVCVALVSIIFAGAFIWTPESPYFHEKNGRRDKTLKSLLLLRGVKLKESIREEIASIARFVESDKTLGFVDTLREMAAKSNRKAVALMLVLNFGTQFAGLLAISAYTEKIFRDVNSPIDPPDAVVLLAAVTLIFNWISSSVVDRVGRKILFLSSCTAMCACNILTGTYVLLSQKGVVDESYAWMAMVGLFGFQVAGSIGLNPLVTVIQAEIFPASIRSWCICILCVYGMGLAVVVTKLFQVIDSTIGGFFAFYLFAFCLLLTLIYSFIFMPETKRMSLNEIQDTLNE